ncbi:hypothetical protein TWF694_006601 [Orbilia ellipsospora]|uniref:Uncharacterized protein n=1 Tax=Orbilia ellipsospora TaxID=2528407 RepID=A0AAV9XSC2_9PEZI
MRVSKIILSAFAAADLVAAHGIFISAVGDANKGVIGLPIGYRAGTPRSDTKVSSGQLDTAVFSNPTRPNEWCKSCPTGKWNAKCKACRIKCPAKKKKRAAAKKAAAKKTTAKKPAAKAGAKKKTTAKKKKTTAKKKKAATKWCYAKNCKKCAYYNYSCAKCRTPLPNGCGRSVYNDNSGLYTLDPGAKPKSVCCKMPANLYVQGTLNIPAWVNKYASANTIAQVTPGGYLDTRLHQINGDGAGPYTCIIDRGGSGLSYNPGTLNILNNVPGVGGINKFMLTQFQLLIQMPKDLTCTGTYGSAKNICMVRCHNTAPNGPFGACFPVQVINKSPPPSPPPIVQPPPAPVNVNITIGIDEEVFPPEEVEQITGVPPDQQPPQGTDAEPDTDTGTDTDTDTDTDTEGGQSTVTVTTPGPSPGTTTVFVTDGTGSTVTNSGTVSVIITTPAGSQPSNGAGQQTVTVTTPGPSAGTTTEFVTDGSGSTVTNSGTVSVIITTPSGTGSSPTTPAAAASSSGDPYDYKLRFVRY